jgi:hypothetical protein
VGAKRSRTLRWRDCLEQILERGGGIEISVENDGDGPDTPASINLVWRVRLYAIESDHIVVEMPGTMGRSFEIPVGSKLVGNLSVGQNRWMFHSSVLGSVASAGRRGFPALRLALPQGVERCRRGSRDRITTAEVCLPEVRCWPLVDPVSAIPAELANRARIRELGLARECADQAPELEAILLPAVGPEATAALANFGGGGVGLRFPANEQIDLDTRNVYWLRLDLRPWLPAPLTVSARLAHTFTDATQQVHAGFAFDFSHNPEHRDFVIEQMELCMQRIHGQASKAA